MTYDLFIGDYAYSSWSLRGWLLFKQLGVKPKIHLIDFNSVGVAEQMKDVAPARTVPTMRTPEGSVVWDSLAMAEELNDRFPDGGLWPKDPAKRALGRSLAAEMHSSYGALRNECPMNLRTAYDAPALSDDTLTDIARIDTIWSHARGLYHEDGPWLLGAYSIADIMFAPVAARFAGYDAQLSDIAQAYVDTHLANTFFRQWRTMGLVTGDTLPWYAKPFATKPWPGPTPLPAKAVESGPSVNTTCPFTGGPVQFFLEFDGRVFGFENQLCRDETVEDPEAWPAFMEMARGS
ncbi:glutathione S-transferase [Marivita hallyeonensis]|uniref:Glutathione S-transferase n=1 Tax=Marivita hallyeonensis TaxID=996342 RepID=A0A1M5M201_9RHOB|nr:glutathione S-transferase [Marivita hallyeonensis]SHG71337.1 glutathione S-transferase [Marivita hallyeonensis]